MRPVHALDITEVPLLRRCTNYLRRTLFAEEHMPRLVAIIMCILMVNEVAAVVIFEKNNGQWRKIVALHKGAWSSHGELLSAHTAALKSAEKRLGDSGKAILVLMKANEDLRRRIVTLELENAPSVRVAPAVPSARKTQKKRLKKQRIRK